MESSKKIDNLVLGGNARDGVGRERRDLDSRHRDARRGERGRQRREGRVRALRLLLTT